MMMGPKSTVAMIKPMTKPSVMFHIVSIVLSFLIEKPLARRLQISEQPGAGFSLGVLFKPCVVG
jgi:hypothetical protein